MDTNEIVADVDIEQTEVQEESIERPVVTEVRRKRRPRPVDGESRERPMRNPEDGRPRKKRPRPNPEQVPAQAIEGDALEGAEPVVRRKKRRKVTPLENLETPVVEGITPFVEEQPQEYTEPFTEVQVREEAVEDFKILEDSPLSVVSSATEEEVIRLDDMEENEIAEFALLCKSVVWTGLSDPVKARKKEIESKYETRALFTIIFMAIVFATTSIHIPVLQPMLNILDRMKMAGALVLVMLFIYWGLTGVVYAYAKQLNPEIKYSDVSRLYAMTFIPGIFMFLAAFLVGYLSAVAALLIVVVNFMYWILLSSQVATYLLEGNSFRANLIMIFISILVFLAIYFTAKLCVMGFITSIMSASVEVVQSSDGSITGSLQSIIQAFINFLRDIDGLF